MFWDSQAKKFVGKKWRIISPVKKFFTHDCFYRRNFMATFFSSNKVFWKTSANGCFWNLPQYSSVLNFQSYCMKGAVRRGGEKEELLVT